MHGLTLTEPVKVFTLTDFLRARGAYLSDVVAVARETLKVGAGDILLAAGSVIEGLGNSRSDLDLLLLTSTRERDQTSDNRTVFVGRCLSDVEVLSLDAITTLLARFDGWCAGSWDVSRASDFTLDQRRLLHRLRHSAVLFDGTTGGAPSLQPRREGLARLKLHVARHMARTIQVDMAGSRDAGDFASLGFAAQDLLGHAVDALSAGHLLTNPTPKWRSRLLATLPSDWSRPLTIRPTDAAADELFWRLHRTPEWPQPEAVVEHAIRSVTFSRAAFVWAERVLLRSWVAPQRRGWPATTPSGPPLPCLDLDVDFVEHAHGAALARLNEFGDVMELSSTELDLALFFDGITTTREAADAIFGEGSASASREVGDLAARLTASGLANHAHPRRSTWRRGELNWH